MHRREWWTEAFDGAARPRQDMLQLVLALTDKLAKGFALEGELRLA
jgi:hypothetical protein